VRPSTARVTVAGRRATVTGGTFRAGVALAPGTNVIDVLASAGPASPPVKRADALQQQIERESTLVAHR